MTDAPLIRIECVTKRFGDVVAVDDVSLEIARGEFFALLGPSGCGKTTLLRMIAGLEPPSAGRIFIDGVDMTDVPPNRRPVNMVFQSYAVFPHMSVRRNVGYGLRVERVAKAEIAARVDEALALVKLGKMADRAPDQLSGGQRQRVALARALVKRPKVLLLDEPLSALDAKLREAMRSELARIHEQVGVTFVMVTHDQDEALAMAARCALMDRGVLRQVGTPDDLYERPESRFAAGFIGSINLFEGRVRGGVFIESPALECVVEFDRALPDAAGAAVWIGIRPEKIAMDLLAGQAVDGANMTRGIVRHASYLGSETVYEVAVAGCASVRVQRPNDRREGSRDIGVGDAVRLAWSVSAPMVLRA